MDGLIKGVWMLDEVIGRMGWCNDKRDGKNKLMGKYDFREGE